MNEPAAPVSLIFSHTEKADNLNGAQREAKLFPAGSRIDVTDGIGLATALVMRGAVASGVILIFARICPADAEHSDPYLTRASIVRTVRKIMQGEFYL